MENLGEDHAYSDSSPSASATHEEYAVPEVIITHRLRDRKMLRKRKAEAEEKESIQWVPRKQKRSKRQRRGRGGRQEEGRQPAVDLSLQPEPEENPLPKSQEDAEPVSSEFGKPVLTTQDLVGGMQPGAAEGNLAAKSQNPVGEEEVLKPTEAEIPEALNTPLEIDHQDD